MKIFLDGNVISSKDQKSPLDKNSLSNNVETNRSTHAVPSNDDISRLSLRDLIHLEHEFYGYLIRVRAKKEELLLEQLEDLREQVAKVPSSTNGNSNTPEMSMNSVLSEIIASQNSETEGNSEDCCPHEAPLDDGPPLHWANISEQTKEISREMPAAKRSKMTSSNEGAIRRARGN